MTDPKQDTMMPFTKTAALASFSTESIQDLSYFIQLVPAEMFRGMRARRCKSAQRCGS
jgi:hypothetical protein